MRKLLIALNLVGLSFASEIDAEDAYASGDYAEAAEQYEATLAENGPNASVLYNLGNARYRLGEYGPAILAYERALLLDPRASDIRTNLKLARDAVAAFDDPERRPWETPLYWLGFDEWLMLGAGALVLLAAVSLLRGFGVPKQKSRTLPAITVVAIVLLFVSIAAVSLRQAELDRAIVIKPDAAVRLSPFDTAEVVATLKAGRPIQIQRKHEDFYLVENGWIAKSDVGRIYPER